MLSPVIWDDRLILMRTAYKSPLNDCTVKNGSGGSRKPKLYWDKQSVKIMI